MKIAVELVGVTKIFRDFWGRARVQALRDVDLAVPKGSIVALLGRNGAGKTTLMQLCLGLLEPTSGRVMVLGGSPADREVKARLGYMPEESTLHAFLTGRETLRLHGGLCGLPRDQAEARSEYLLSKVKLIEAADRPVREYSKGMARRLCLAQALIGDPELLVLDEPTSGLDPFGAHLVKDLLLELKSMGRTIFLSTHLLGEIAQVADQVAVLESGRLLCAGSREELLRGDRWEIIADNLPEHLIPRLEGLLRLAGARRVAVRREARSLEEFFLEAVTTGAQRWQERSR